MARLGTIFIVLGAAVLAATAARAQVDLVVIPSSRADKYDADVYRTIWGEYGERIISALEARTCMPFPETDVFARVAEAVSNSGGPEYPMRLRASYDREVKASTLVHELGHRHLWQLGERLDDIDSHMTLYLVLDLVWADVWGEDFSERRVRGESEWDSDYADAWSWARSLHPDRRTALWNRLLAMNGYQKYCYALLDEYDSQPQPQTVAAQQHGRISRTEPTRSASLR